VEVRAPPGARGAGPSLPQGPASSFRGPMDFARRAARNEELVRDVNRQIEEGASLHEVTSSMPLHCECAELGCLEKIDVDPRTYKPILDQRYRFIVVPGHV